MGIADKEEYLKTYSEDGTFIKKEKRSIVHKKQLFHNEVALWLINSNKELLLEKRSKYKMLNPDKYSLCAGHVVEDDSIEDTIIREAQEEIGIDISNYDYNYAIVVTRKEPNNYCFSYHYVLFADIKLSDFKIQHEELSEVIYMNYELFKQKVKSNDKTIALKWTDAYKKVFDCIDIYIQKYFQNK